MTYEDDDCNLIRLRIPTHLGSLACVSRAASRVSFFEKHERCMRVSTRLRNPDHNLVDGLLCLACGCNRYRYWLHQLGAEVINGVLTALGGAALVWLGSRLRNRFWQLMRDERSYTPLAHQQWAFFYAILITLLDYSGVGCFILAAQSLLRYLS